MEKLDAEDMFDRLVRRLAGSPTDEDAANSLTTRPFSVFSNAPNIVLLGDPGAGKTSLFNSARAASGGTFHTVRSFLNTPMEQCVGTLFLDGLDEERNRSAGDRIIDQVVQKLHVVRPTRLRLSCRAVDWLGPSDLSALMPYFDVRGGYDVLSLEPLTVQQQATLLETRGVSDSSAFLGEAHRRGLQDFLGNPQTLVLLAHVVEGGAWPESRYDLFERAATVLVGEVNTEHRVAHGGVFDTEMLLGAAGHICAARLLSGVSGLSLQPRTPTSDHPQAASVDPSRPDLVRAVLSRQLFRLGADVNTVDYTHRTTAEYLGVSSIKTGFNAARRRAQLDATVTPHILRHTSATWMAQKGVPISRIAQLLGDNENVVQRVYAKYHPDYLQDAVDAVDF